jgi:hypothetical protein
VNKTIKSDYTNEESRISKRVLSAMGEKARKRDRECEGNKV